MTVDRKIVYGGFFALAISFFECSEDEPEPLSRGDFYEGGVVFYLDASGKHGLICTLDDQSAGAEWCSSVADIAGAEGQGIGSGLQNSLDIVAECSGSENAASLCLNLTANGHNDWHLPSKAELNEMYLNKTLIDATAASNGGSALAEDTYWSSTELDIGDKSSAWTHNLGTGNSGALTKFGTARVRAIRAF